MRSTITLSTLLAAAAVASVSAETNCNPTYDVPTSGECFTGCNVVNIIYTSSKAFRTNYICNNIESWC